MHLTAGAGKLGVTVTVTTVEDDNVSLDIAVDEAPSGGSP